uniref:Uncharacterized protein n=1 Tax=Anguilla anguilla TaxID=7936 RepID=A0A0E9V2F5_ANGAN
MTMLLFNQNMEVKKEITKQIAL